MVLQHLGGPISESLEGVLVVVCGGEDDDEDRGNVAGVGYDLQVSRAVSVVIWDQQLGGNGIHAKINMGLHHQELRRIAGMTAQRTTIGEWEWTLMNGSLDTSGLCPIKGYIHSRQYSVAAQVACRYIYELCTGADRVPVTSRFMRQWDKDV